LTSFFVLWLVVASIWLYVDLRRLQRPSLTKLVYLIVVPKTQVTDCHYNRRCLWHVGGCAASLYFFMSILHITSENLPQWLPTIIECGLGTSIGIRSIPSASRDQARDYISSVTGSVFGATQVVVRSEQGQPLQRNDPTWV
jgi:hypothetical protein